MARVKARILTAATIDVIADGTATEHLVGLLRTALGPAEGVDIRWAERAGH